MSPLEYIANGIREGNWETVCEGYERLTGERLPLPVEKPGEVTRTREVLSQIVEIASSLLSESTMEPKKKRGRPKGSGSKTNKKGTVTEDGEDSTVNLDENKKTVISKSPGKIQLITNDPDPEEVKRNAIKHKRAKANKAQLNREDVKTYKVKCNECRQDFQSSRPESQMGQKCEECLSGLRGRFSK